MKLLLYLRHRMQFWLFCFYIMFYILVFGETGYCQTNAPVPGKSAPESGIVEIIADLYHDNYSAQTIDNTHIDAGVNDRLYRRSGNIIFVQPGDDFTKIENAGAGDIVEIAPGTYRFRVRLSNHGTESEPIIIRALDPDNPPVFDLGGDWCGDWPGSWSNNRAIFHIDGSFYKISDIVFRGAHQAANSADASGIRSVGAQNITVQNCLFEYNDNGVQGTGENILYEFCEFRYNGKTNGQTGDAAHNIYTHGGTFTFCYCYIHDPLEGQNIHSRSRYMLVKSCLIEYARSYTADIMVDGNEWVSGQPLYQTLTISGCIIKESPNQINNTKAFTLYNSPSHSGVYMKLLLFYNTFIGNGNNGSVIRFTDSGLAGHEVYMVNNIFFKKHDPARFDGNSAQSAIVLFDNNWWPEGYDYSSDSSFMFNSIFGINPGFRDAANNDFGLTGNAQVNGLANPALCAAPQYEFDLDYMRRGEYKLRKSAQDLGAYEHCDSSVLVPENSNRDIYHDQVNQNFILRQNYPNPFNATTQIQCDISKPSRIKLEILNIRGQNVITLTDRLLGVGIYTFDWNGKDQKNRHVVSGLYICRVTADEHVMIKKMLLIR